MSNTFDPEAIDSRDYDNSEIELKSHNDINGNVVINRTIILWAIVVIVVFFTLNSYVIVQTEKHVPRDSMKRVIIFSLCGSLNSIAGFLVFCLIAVLIFPPQLFQSIKILRDSI